MRTGIFSWIFLGLFALLTAVPTGPVLAQPYGPPPDRDGSRVGPGDGVQPLDRLLPGIRRQHPGDFYDAEGPTYGPSGDPHYHLKWMTPDGRVIWYDADARSGRVLRSSPGRDSFDNHRFEDRPGGGYGQPYMGRYPPYTAEPYDRGSGRQRNFGPGPGYARPYRDWGGDRGGDRGDSRGGGRWRH
ncbi:MAG TPA: hypothetical protein VKB94_02890 [Rhizomicrobium sp.]|nr:hypothetical protein [Rhizomicrobium sp.]